MEVFTTLLLYMIMVFSYEASVALAPGSVYVEPYSMVVSLLPFSVMFGGHCIYDNVRACQIVLCYPSCISLEFVTKISNVRLPFVSF